MRRTVKGPRKQDSDGTSIEEEEETRKRLSAKLIDAAGKGQMEEVRRLLQLTLFKGMDVHGWKSTALTAAAEKGNVDVVALLLLDEGRVFPGNESGALLHAAVNGHADVVSLLMKDGRADPAFVNNAAVSGAAGEGHVDVLKLLLRDARVDPADQGNWAVHVAARNGQVESVRLLLQDERVDGARAIWYAHRRVVPVLIEDERCGIKVNKKLFEQQHSWAVELHTQLCRKRTDIILATLWCMKEIGNGWADLKEPTRERIQKASLNWEK